MGRHVPTRHAGADERRGAEPAAAAVGAHGQLHVVSGGGVGSGGGVVVGMAVGVGAGRWQLGLWWGGGHGMYLCGRE